MPTYIVKTIEYARVRRSYRIEAASTDEAVDFTKSRNVKLIAQTIEQDRNGKLITDGSILLDSVRAESRTK